MVEASNVGGGTFNSYHHRVGTTAAAVVDGVLMRADDEHSLRSDTFLYVECVSNRLRDKDSKIQLLSR